MRPNVVVTGYMRSGTSMMMQALEASGYPLLYSPKSFENLVAANDLDDASVLNPHEVYEFNPEEWNNAYFPQNHPGVALKVRYREVVRLAPMKNGIHFIQMRRNPLEIRDSIEAVFGRKAEAWLSESGQYERRMGWSLDHMHNRRDALSVTVVEYPLVDSLLTFGALAHVGIDVWKAAAVYSDEHYRIRVNGTQTAGGHIGA